jgi:hypothetical protein
LGVELLARYAVVSEQHMMTLIQSAKMNGLYPYAYLSDVLKGCRHIK